MSSDGVRDAIHSAMQDETFLDEFRADPEAALAEFDLTDEERAALASGDSDRIRGITDDEMAADHIYDFFSAGPTASALHVEDDGTVRHRSAD